MSDRSGTVVAVVAGTPITVGAVDARVDSIRADAGADRLPTPGSGEDRRLRRWIVSALVNEALVEAEARSAGLVPPGGEHCSGALTLLFEHLTADVTVDDAEVARYHRDNADRYHRPERRLVRQVVLEDRSAAQRLRRCLASGSGWAAVADAVPPSAPLSAESAWLRRGEMAGVFEDVVFTARPGMVLGPIGTEFGWHVAEVLDIEPEHAVPTEAAAASIRADLLAAARGRCFDAWLSDRRHRLATVSPGWEPPGDPRVPDSVHRH